MDPAWQKEYKGNAAELFTERVVEANKGCHKRGKLNGHKKLFPNFIPLLQSTGMGKSRLVDEVGKKIFTLSLCLKNDGDNSQSDSVHPHLKIGLAFLTNIFIYADYPKPDSSARDALKRIVESAYGSTDGFSSNGNFFLFFTGILQAACERIKKDDIHKTVQGFNPNNPQGRYELLAQTWRVKVMNDEKQRNSFFKDALNRMSLEVRS